MAKFPSDESSMPMLPQHHLVRDEEEIPLDDNESDVTKVCSGAPYGKSVHIRERSPSNLSTWSYDAPMPARTRRRQLTLQAMTWLRWSVVVFLQTVMIILLWRQNVRGGASGESDTVLKGKIVETGDDINGLYKTGWCSQSDAPSTYLDTDHP
jgi:hypothetical protein